MRTSPIMTSAQGGHGARYYGKYRGTVTNNSDPKKLGRIKARVPGLLTGIQTGWALPCAPYAGKGEGQFTVPPVDARVWIEFEAGCLSNPIWSGCWWEEDRLPRDNNGTSATPSLNIIRSQKGLMVTLDDDSQIITVSDDNGNNMLEIQVEQGKITLKGATQAVVEAKQIELTQGANEPVVFGTRLEAYLTQLVGIFNAHVHIGVPVPVPTSPPLKPIEVLPLQAQLTSTRVKTG